MDGLERVFDDFGGPERVLEGSSGSLLCRVVPKGSQRAKLTKKVPKRTQKGSQDASKIKIFEAKMGTRVRFVVSMLLFRKSKHALSVPMPTQDDVFSQMFVYVILMTSGHPWLRQDINWAVFCLQERTKPNNRHSRTCSLTHPSKWPL